MSQTMRHHRSPLLGFNGSARSRTLTVSLIAAIHNLQQQERTRIKVLGNLEELVCEDALPVGCTGDVSRKEHGFHRLETVSINGAGINFLKQLNPRLISRGSPRKIIGD